MTFDLHVKFLNTLYVSLVIGWAILTIKLSEIMTIKLSVIMIIQLTLPKKHFANFSVSSYLLSNLIKQTDTYMLTRDMVALWHKQTWATKFNACCFTVTRKTGAQTQLWHKLLYIRMNIMICYFFTQHNDCKIVKTNLTTISFGYNWKKIWKRYQRAHLLACLPLPLRGAPLHKPSRYLHFQKCQWQKHLSLLIR